MAARPNSKRTLEYGVRLATNHLARLDDMIEMSQRALDENRLLTPEDVYAYKQCIRAGKKQATQFRKILQIAIPDVDTATTRRKRGRPSKEELEELAEAREEAPKAKPKRRRRRKAAAATEEEAPTPPKRKRGRPKGSKNKTKRKPGRPKGSKNKPKTDTATAATAEAPATEAPKRRRRGRPKGSKNKPKAEAA